MPIRSRCHTDPVLINVRLFSPTSQSPWHQLNAELALTHIIRRMKQRDAMPCCDERSKSMVAGDGVVRFDGLSQFADAIRSSTLMPLSSLSHLHPDPVLPRTRSNINAAVAACSYRSDSLRNHIHVFWSTVMIFLLSARWLSFLLLAPPHLHLRGQGVRGMLNCNPGPEVSLVTLGTLVMAFFSLCGV